MERFSIKKAQEEAGKMKDKISSGESENYNEAEKIAEKDNVQLDKDVDAKAIKRLEEEENKIFTEIEISGVDDLAESIKKLSQKTHKERMTSVHREGLLRIIPELKKLILKPIPTKEEQERIKELYGYLKEEDDKLFKEVNEQEAKKEKPAETEKDIVFEKTKSFEEKNQEIIDKEFGKNSEELPDEEKKTIKKPIEKTEEETEKPEETKQKIEKETETEKQTEEKSKIDLSPEQEQKIEEAFLKFNISKEDLENMEGFSDLSFGQRLLVAENLNHLIVKEAKKEAKTTQETEAKESRFKNMLKLALTLGASKTFQTADLEKSILQKKISEGVSEDNKTYLEQMIKSSKELCPDVEVSEDGKLEIQYIKQSEFEKLTLIEKIDVLNFNKAAKEFSKIPNEWKYDTAKESERQAYEEKKSSYDKLRDVILKLKTNLEDEKSAALFMNAIDEKVAINSLLSSNPDIEKEIQKITNQSALAKAAKELINPNSNLAYASYGYAARAGVVAVLGVTSPLVIPAIAGAAGGIGFFKSRKEAEKAVSARKALGREGKEVKEKLKYETAQGEKKERELKEFTDASFFSKRINRLKDKIESIDESDPDFDNQLEILEKKIYETMSLADEKFKRGLINFGDTKEQITNKLDFVQSMGRARAYTKTNIQNTENKVSEILKSVGEHQNTAENIRKKEVWKKARNGALIRAGFASAGAAIAGFVHSPETGKPETLEDQTILKKESEFPESQIKEFPPKQEITFSETPKIASEENTAKLYQWEDKNNIDHSVVVNIHKELVKNPELETGLTDKNLKFIENNTELFKNENAAEKIQKLLSQNELIYEVRKGDNLWNIIGNMDELNGLEGGQKSNAIANIIEDIKKDPETLKTFGFENPKDINNLKIGQKIDLEKIKEILETTEIKGKGIIEHAQELDEKTIANIEGNNAKIDSFYDELREAKAENPDIKIPQLNEDMADKIIKGEINVRSYINPEVSGQQAVESAVDISSIENIKDAITNGKTESIIGEYNEDLFEGVSGEVLKNGDTVVSFNVKNNAADVKLIITQEGKMAIDGWGLRNWPENVKLGWLFGSRKLDTFTDLTDKNMKEALEFINKGKAIIIEKPEE